MRALSIELGDAAIMLPGADGDSRARAPPLRAIAATKRAEFYSLGLVLGYGYGPDAAAQAPTTDVYRPQVTAGNRLPHARVGRRELAVRPSGSRVHRAWTPTPAAKLIMDAAADRGVPIVARRSAGLRLRAGRRATTSCWCARTSTSHGSGSRPIMTVGRFRIHP